MYCLLSTRVSHWNLWHVDLCIVLQLVQDNNQLQIYYVRKMYLASNPLCKIQKTGLEDDRNKGEKKVTFSPDEVCKECGSFTIIG